MNTLTLNMIISKFHLKVWQNIKDIYPWGKLLDTYYTPFHIQANYAWQSFDFKSSSGGIKINKLQLNFERVMSHSR